MVTRFEYTQRYGHGAWKAKTYFERNGATVAPRERPPQVAPAQLVEDARLETPAQTYADCFAGEILGVYAAGYQVLRHEPVHYEIEPK